MSESTIEKLQDLCEEHGCPPGINRFTWLDYMLNKVAKLEAERDALRKDAARYRFIKDDRIVLAGGPWPVAPFGEECDRKIDAAIAAKEPK